jgi:autoinducer 2 (AI-2) kinase
LADYLLALDAGTSAGRALVLRRDGMIVATGRRDWSYDTPPDAGPLARSFDPEAFWLLLADATRDALDEASLSGGDIAAVGVTSQRLANVAIDRDGRPFYGGPNSDARAVGEGLAIDARMADRVYDVSGKLPSLILAPARVQWLRKHQPDDFARMQAMFTEADWFAFRLTGQVRMERSLAADCGLLNVAAREPDGELLAELDVPLELLPPLVNAGDVVGDVRGDASNVTGLRQGTPVVACGADSQCALIGMGVTEPGEAGIVTGWSCTVHQVTAGPKFDPQRRTWPGLHLLPDRWVVESSAANAGHVWRWWCETLLCGEEAALEQGAELAAQAPPGARGLLALLGPGPMNAAAMGIHLGGLIMTTPIATHDIGRADLLRAALENVAYALRANLEQAEEVSGQRSTRVAVGGGLTRIGVFPSLLASVLDRPIEVAQDTEASARGAAVVIGRALGIDVPACPTTTVHPDEPAAAVYRTQYERWRKLGAALDDVMPKL